MITLSENARKELEAYFADKERQSIRVFLAPAAEAARVSPWLWMSLTHRTAPRKLTVSPSAWPPTWWRRSRASRLI